MTDRRRSVAGLALAAVMVAFVAVVVASSGDGAGGGSIPNDADGAFITGMVAHHKSALEMAAIAVEQAEHSEVRELAEEIMRAQNREIDALNSAHRRIYGEPVPASAMQHGALAGDAPIGSPEDLKSLRNARPFDRTFIAMMVEHHRGAVRMAEAEVDRGGDPEMRRLADRIIATQSREIDQMLAWRASWYAER